MQKIDHAGTQKPNTAKNKREAREGLKIVGEGGAQAPAKDVECQVGTEEAAGPKGGRELVVFPHCASWGGRLRTGFENGLF